MSTETTKPSPWEVPISLILLALGVILAVYDSRQGPDPTDVDAWMTWRAICTTLVTVGVYGLAAEALFGRIRMGWITIPVLVLLTQQIYVGTYNASIRERSNGGAPAESAAFSSDVAVVVDPLQSTGLMDRAQIDALYEAASWSDASDAGSMGTARLNDVKEVRFGRSRLCGIIEADESRFARDGIQSAGEHVTRAGPYPKDCVVSYPLRGDMPRRYIRLTQPRDGSGFEVVDQDGRVLLKQGRTPLHEMAHNPIIIAGCDQRGAGCLPHFSEGRIYFSSVPSTDQEIAILGLKPRTKHGVLSVPQEIGDEIERIPVVSLGAQVTP